MREFGLTLPEEKENEDPFYKSASDARQSVIEELGMGRGRADEVFGSPAPVQPIRTALADYAQPLPAQSSGSGKAESNADFISRLAAMNAQPPAQQKKKDDSDFTRRFSDTFTETKQLAYGSLAALADFAGADKIRDNFLGKYSAAEKDVQSRAKASDSLSNVLEGNGDFIDWLQAGAGYVAGQAVQTVAAAGAGAILGSAAPGAGTVAGGLAGLFGKEGVKTGLKRILAEKLQAYEAKALAAGATEQAARQAAVQQAFKGLGAAAAVQTLNFTQELGSIYPEAVEEAKKTGEEYSLGRVFASAVAASGIDTLTDIYGIKVLKGAKGGGAVLPNIAKEGFKQGLLEGGTEGAQTVIERFGAKKDLANDEAIREYVDSIGLGTLGGGLRGGLTGVAKSFRPEDAGTKPPGTDEKPKISQETLDARQKMLDDPEIGPKLQANGITSPDDPRLEILASRIFDRKSEVKQITEILGVTRSGVEMPASQKELFDSLSFAKNGREFVQEIQDNPDLQKFLKDLPGTSGFAGNRYEQIMGLFRTATEPKGQTPIIVGAPTQTLTGKENLPTAATGKEAPGLVTSVEQINAELAKEEKRTQDAFRLAELRRQRAQQEVELSGVQPMDTQAGGRPGGIGAQQEFAYFNPVIKDGQMVSGDRVEVVSGDQILDRITLGGLQTTPERAIFLRFLDRPGQPEFPVPLSLAKQYVQFLNRPESPRAAQDFADTAVAPRAGTMTDPEATRGGPRLATDRITTDQRQQFVAADQTPPGTGVAPTRGGRTFEAEPVSQKLEAPGAKRAKEASQRLSAPVEGQTSTQPSASTVAPPSASQTTSEAPGAAKAKKTSKRKTKKTSQPEGTINAAQEGNQQQGDQRQRPGDVAGREAGGREDRQRQAQEPQARAEDRGRGGAQEGRQGTLDLKRKYLGEDVQSIDELNRVVDALVKKEDPNGTFKAVRVPLGDLVGKLPGVGLIEQAAKLFGKRVVFFRVTEGADFFDGTVLPSDSAIFVNVTSDRAHIRIFGHELVHDLRKAKPKVYQQLVDALQPMLDERGFANYAELQKAEGVQTADKILEEAIGDIVGDRFGETEFWKMMSDNNPSTFKDIARAVMSFIDRVLGKLGNGGLGSETLVKDLRSARSEIARILAQSGEEGAASQGSAPAFARKRDGVARDNTAAYVTDKELRKVRAILPDHPDAAEHLRMRELHLSKGTGDYKNERRVLEKDGFRFVIGRVTTQDWIDRVLSAMTPQEVLVFRHWYRDTVGEFKAKFGDRWQEYMIAYLLGNKAESPRGALNNALFVAETTGAGGKSERLGGLSDEQMKQIFAGEAVSLNGIGAKLYDFVDSALGKTTRSWMGNAVEGASPFVVDRHTFRDSGRVDPLLRDWLASKFGAEAVRGIVLDTPVTGSVSSAQYEQITDWGNALADDLNSRGFGGGNLMPLEVQAIGWMAMTRLTETNAGGTTEGAMAGMTKTVAAELDFGAGTPFSKKFAAYYDLSKEAQKRVTHEALREVMAVASELTGVRLVDVSPGIGGWADVVSPNVVARFMSSDQTAEALVATVAYLGQQTSVLAIHPANAATGDRVVFDIAGSDMSDSFVESTLWKAVSKELEPVFGRNIGFMPAVRPDGSPSIRIAIPLPFGTKKNGEPKTVKDFNVGERLELERRLVEQVSPALERALASLPSGTYKFAFMRVKGVESINEWTKKGEQNGESHKRRVGERFGPEVQGRLDSVGVPRVERAIADAIRRENPSFSRKRKTPAAPDSRGVPQSGRVRGSDVSLEVDGRKDSRIGEPLEGGPRQVDIPGVGLVRVGKFQPAVEAAQAYMARAGLQYTPPKTFARVDPDRARRIADEYDRMAHAPGNPEVRAAYDAMIAETVAQYRAILGTGLQVEFIDFEKTGDPYAASPRLAIQDVVENNHLWVFSTADGFGSNESFTPDQNPLLRDTGFTISGKPALANDLFRVVHDYFGHIKNGVGFRADGEENAWRAHSAMYTPLARRAMTSETRGQNSWVNFGPKAETNRGASAANTVYADQKTGLLPEWVSTEGAEDVPSFSRKRDVNEGREYESRLFGGAYDAARLRTAAKDAPIRAMINQARERYNAIREERGLAPVTDWSKRPDVLVDDAPSSSRKRDVLAGIDDTVNSISPGRRTFIKRMVGMAVAISLPQSRAFASNFNSSVRNGNLQGALSAIETGSTNPAFRTLAKKLKGLTNNTMSLTLVEPGKVYPRGIPASLSFGAAGVARVNRQDGGIDIFLRSDVGSNEETLLHEAIHAALLARYDLLSVYLANKTLRGKNADPALKLYEGVWNEFYSHVNRHFKRYKGTALAEDLRGSLPLGVQAAYQNPDEFITYALTDPETQAWMQSRKYDGKSLWGRFKEFVASTLGFGGTTPSWFDAALRVGNEVLDQALQDAPDYATSKAVAKKFGKNEGVAMAVTPVENRGGVEDGDATPSFSRKRPQTGAFNGAAQQTLTEGPSWMQGLPTEMQESLRKVGAVPAKLTIGDRFKAMKENFGAKVVQGVFDKFRRIQDLDPVAYMQARMSTAVDGAFEYLINSGQVKWEGGWLKDVPGTKGLRDILKQLPSGEIDRFFWWIAANRAERLSAEEREFLFSGKDIASLKRLNQSGVGQKVADRPIVYAKVLNQLNQLNKSVLDVAKQSGLINDQQYARYAADAFYVPFYRLMEDGDIGGPATAAGLVGQNFSKRLKGGKEQLNDLLANYMNNWEHVLTASAKNMAGRSTLEAAVNAGIATEVKGDPPKGSVKVMVDGKATHYVVDDPMLLDSISALYSPALSGYGVKIMGAFKRVFTKTVTISPVFKFYNNLIRDAITSQALSPELSNNPIANTYRGYKLNDPKNPLYNSMLVGGGLFKHATWDEGDRHTYVKRLIDKGVDPNTILNTPEKIKAFMSGAFDRYMEFGDRFENAQRAAIYEQATKAGKSQLEAAFLARQPIDFSLTGSFAAIRYLTAILPFFNARLQGLYSLGKYGIAPTARVMSNMTNGKPSDANDMQRAMRFSAVAGAVTAATILLYLMYKDDEDFKRREDWDRDGFWWFKIGDVGWRIPKPFEIGAFATIVERGLEQIVDSSVEGKVFGRRLWAVVTDQLSMNPIPQVIRPAIDVYANYDSFRDQRIESLSMQRLPKEFRSNPNTSFVANAFGSISSEVAGVLKPVIGSKPAEAVQLSPVQIDFLIKGYLGWVGAQSLAVADSMARTATDAPEQPTPRFQDRLPVKALLGGTFQELPTRGNKLVGQFYEQAREVDEVMSAIRHFRAAKDFEKANQILEENRDKVALAKMYQRAEKHLSEINKRIRLITADKSMSADEKRASIDQLEQIRDEIAGSAESSRKSMR